MNISGHTRVIAHIGVPTESFKAPLIYNPWFEQCGADVVVVPMGCEPADFPDFLRTVSRLRNFAGALITMPHKVSVVDLLDEASATVAVCGSCNAVKREGGRIVGDMFDGEGFVRGMERKGRVAAGASALVVGAGGVGSAIAASLAKAGIAQLGLFDADPARAEALGARLIRHFPATSVTTGSKDPSGWDIAVNATPLGMKPGDPLPFDPALLAAGTFVGEVVMTREVTPLLEAARARGCQTQVGTDMLFEMIPAYLEFFGLPVAEPETLRKLARLPSDS